MILSNSDGELLVKTARMAITKYLTDYKKIDLTDEFKEKFSFNSGVFVTLNKNEDLRGCIGFPTPDRKLHQSSIEAAIASSTEDPRFLPVSIEEMREITVEVTVLTPPSVIKVNHPLEYPKMIRVGRDGLIVRWRYGSGLLLPQVPLEYGWNEEEFLNHTCEKAGAPPNCWKQKGTIVLKFEGIVFREKTPDGPVIKLEL